MSLSDDNEYYYNYEQMDDQTLESLSSEIKNVINKGDYDTADAMIDESMNERPEDIFLHRLAIRVLEERSYIPTCPQDSTASKRMKQKFLSLIKEYFPDLTHKEHIKYSEMLFNKFYYFIEYQNEETLDTIISEIPDFNLFKTI